MKPVFQKSLKIIWIFIKILCGLFLLVFLNAFIPLLGFLEIIFRVSFGWIFYLWRTLPKVSLDIGTLFFSLACLATASIGLHSFLRWFYSQLKSSQGQIWKARWTGAFVGLVTLTFATSIAAIGVIHQTTWFLKGPIGSFNWGFNKNLKIRVRNIASIREIEKMSFNEKISAQEIRKVLGSDPSLLNVYEDLHFLVIDDGEGKVKALVVFKRDLHQRKKSGVISIESKGFEQYSERKIPSWISKTVFF